MGKITANNIQDAASHWLTTPAGAYLGSYYGFDKSAVVLRPNRPTTANAVISKLRGDVPLLQAVPPSAINLYGEPKEDGTMNLYLEVIDKLIPVEGQS